MGNANQIGLEVTLVIQLCPQTPACFLRPIAVGVWQVGGVALAVLHIGGWGLAEGPRQVR